MSQRASVKSTIQKKISKIPSRKKIDDQWRKQVAPTLPQVKVVVQRMISGQKEMKYNDVQASTTSDGATGNIVALTDIVQGQADTQRIGDTIQIKNIEYRFSWNASDAFNFGRLIMFRWKPFYGSTTPSVTKILQQLGSASTGVYSPLTHDQRDQFEVLLDVTTKGMTGVYEVPSQMFRGRWTGPKSAKSNTQYLAGSTTNVSNGIYILHCTDSLVVTHPGFNYYFRVNYQDA